MSVHMGQGMELNWILVCINAFLSVNRLCMLVCFGVPFIGAILPLLTNDYGPAGVYCGVKATVTGIIWRFVM